MLRDHMVLPLSRGRNQILPRTIPRLELERQPSWLLNKPIFAALIVIRDCDWTRAHAATNEDGVCDAGESNDSVILFY